ncbi:probable E3 ubiquitin-protein ligase ARI7 [Daucus carota subsp. sativus]
MDLGFDDISFEDHDEKTNFRVLKVSDIEKIQEDAIASVCSLLSVPKDSACILLYHFKWNVESLMETWFSDEERVKKNVGLVKKASFANSLDFTCGICFDVFPAHDKMACSCDHMYCHSCLGTYISISIDEGPGCLSLRCPDPSCKAAVGVDMVSLLVSDEYWKKFRKYFVRSFVEGNSRVKWCPAPDCDAAIEYYGDDDGERGSYEVVCSCSFKFCWRCIEEDHRPIDCDTVVKWIQKNKCEAQNVEWILAYTKPCPKCKRAIEKNMGCMHMTCNRSCGHEFCWTCLGPWSNYHHCNTYKSGQKNKTENAEDKRRQNAKESLERYTHYFERWDANHKSRMKAQTDLEKMQEKNLNILCEKFALTKLRLKFVSEAWEQIIECRRTLKWSYAYGYFIPENKCAKVALFQYLQGQAEVGLERLHQCAEKELIKLLEDHEATADQFDVFRVKLVDLTSVTRNYFSNLVTALENDLCESEHEGQAKRKGRNKVEKRDGKKRKTLV